MADPIINPENNNQNPPVAKPEKMTLTGAAPIARKPRKHHIAVNTSGTTRVAKNTIARREIAETRMVTSSAAVVRTTAAVMRAARPAKRCDVVMETFNQPVAGSGVRDLCQPS